MRRLSTWVLMALAGGTLFAGCGSTTSTSTETVSGTTGPASAATTSASATTTSTPAATTVAGAAPAHHASAKSPTRTATKPAAPKPPTTSVKATAGTWHSTQCQLTMAFWEKGHPHYKAAERLSYKVSLTKAHGCFTDRSLPG